ncbi:MAG: hypothetical protein JST55_08680 [Bacteroidetes bacterium]|nr:hypothetical protein [Bacteroidota bacterium]
MKKYLLFLVLSSLTIFYGCSNRASYNITLSPQTNEVRGLDSVIINAHITKDAYPFIPSNAYARSTCGEMFKITPDYNSAADIQFYFKGNYVDENCLSDITVIIANDTNVQGHTQVKVLPPVIGGYVNTLDTNRPQVKITPDVIDLKNKYFKWQYQIDLVSYFISNHITKIEITSPAQFTNLRVINTSFGIKVKIVSEDGNKKWIITPENPDVKNLNKVLLEAESNGTSGGRVLFKVFDKDGNSTEDLQVTGPNFGSK